MTTGQVASTLYERFDLADAINDIRELLNEEAWRMSEQCDFKRVVNMAKAELRIFRKNHSEEVTRILAEKICEYAVFDVRQDTRWQTDAYEYQFEMSSRVYGLSPSEYSKAIEWTLHDFQFEPMGSKNGTTLCLIATIGYKSTVVLEAVIWQTDNKVLIAILFGTVHWMGREAPIWASAHVYA